jgi:hypothetical protein
MTEGMTRLVDRDGFARQPGSVTPDSANSGRRIGTEC